MLISHRNAPKNGAEDNARDPVGGVFKASYSITQYAVEATWRSEWAELHSGDQFSVHFHQRL
jgi:hypothetical protein